MELSTGEDGSNSRDELRIKGRRRRRGIREKENDMNDLGGDGMVVEEGERVEERGDEEVRVEREKGMEKRGVRESTRKLREGVRDMEGGGSRVGEEIGEADEADSASFHGLKDEARSVALRAC